mmetsp:Transcript_68867/g.121654  ORF Transcript_68867/g.121654 Transcript_68867/m.121654 type:complete len:270 (+) Transcript_68867:748-1557(+)
MLPPDVVGISDRGLRVGRLRNFVLHQRSEPVPQRGVGVPTHVCLQDGHVGLAVSDVSDTRWGVEDLRRGPVHQRLHSFRQLIEGDAVPGADVHGLEGLLLQVTFHVAVQGLCDILHKDEVPGLLAVPEDGNVLLSNDLVRKEGDDARVRRVGVLAGAVDVEETAGNEGGAPVAGEQAPVLLRHVLLQAVRRDGVPGLVLSDGRFGSVSISGSRAGEDDAGDVSVLAHGDHLEGGAEVVVVRLLGLVPGGLNGGDGRQVEHAVERGVRGR